MNPNWSGGSGHVTDVDGQRIIITPPFRLLLTMGEPNSNGLRLGVFWSSYASTPDSYEYCFVTGLSQSCSFSIGDYGTCSAFMEVLAWIVRMNYGFRIWYCAQQGLPMSNVTGDLFHAELQIDSIHRLHWALLDYLSRLQGGGSESED